MAIVDYDTLKDAVQTWAARRDTTFAGQIPTFVSLAEDRLYNGAGMPGDPIHTAPLRSSTMDVTATIALASGLGTLPADILEIRSLSIVDQRSGIEYLPPERFQIYKANSAGTIPEYYTVFGNKVEVSPGASTNLRLSYFARYPEIGPSNKTGPLIIQHGLIYLALALYEAFAFIQDTETALAHLARARGMIDGANRTMTNIRTAGPLRIRQRVPMP